MKYTLSDICEYAKGKIDVATLNENTYISTENMMSNKAGITSTSSLPTVTQTQSFIAGDVLVSNIRPYFKKIWFAEFYGGCSNDVLVFRTKDGVNKRFLYYVLAEDKFFDYVMATSKGTKMPRGDKTAIMKYEVPDFTHEEQEKIAGILGAIDDKIALNAKINENLYELKGRDRRHPVHQTLVWVVVYHGKQTSLYFQPASIRFHYVLGVQRNETSELLQHRCGLEAA